MLVPDRFRRLAWPGLPALLLIAHTAVAQQAAPPAAPPPAATTATAPATDALSGTAPAALDGAAAAATGTEPTAATTPAAISADAAAVTTEVANPYGLEALWAQGDFVVHFTLVILVVMSMATWYVMVTKFLEQMRLHASARAAGERFWQTASVADGLAQLKAGSAFHYLAQQAAKAAGQYEGALRDRIDMHTWLSLGIDRASAEINNRLTRGLAVLATVGSTAPFIGLFGTVWGIYHALTAIGIAGQASIDKVAGPVGEALIMTAIGLAVAVPAVLGYNFLVRRNKVAMEAVRRFGGELHTVLLGGKRAGA